MDGDQDRMQVHQIYWSRLGLVQFSKTIKDCIRVGTGRDYARGSVRDFWWCNEESLPKKMVDPLRATVMTSLLNISFSARSLY